MLVHSIDVEAREQRIFIGVCVDLSGIHIDLCAPDEARLAALVNNGIEEATETGDTVAVADFG